jgi:hypothetical protein
MKSKAILTIAALLAGAVLTAQTTEPVQSQNHRREQAQTQTRTQDPAQAQTQTRTQDPVQAQTQTQYKNQGQMVSDQKHARNQERKAQKNQEKEMKRQQKELKKQEKKMKQDGTGPYHKQNMEKGGAGPRNQGAKPSSGNHHKPANGSRGGGQGKR